MQYDKDLIIAAFDLLLEKEYTNWSIGSISSEEYFELRVQEMHHHCPCNSVASVDIIYHFINKGLSIHEHHKPGSEGVLFIKSLIQEI